MEQAFFEIKKVIDKAGKILLSSHSEPDGDAISSMLALKIALEKIGKDVDVFCAAPIPEEYNFLPRAEQIKNNLSDVYDIVIGLDYGDLKRLETMALGVPLEPGLTLDHHPFLNQPGELNVIDPVSSSTCEIVYQFLEANSLEVDKEIATCLLTGIFADTWSFRHPNTTAKTLKAVGELLLKGAPLQKIARASGQKNIDARSKIWSRAMQNLCVEEQLGLVFSSVSLQDLAECGATGDDMSGFAALLSMIPEARISLLLTEAIQGQIDASLRAMPGRGIDVGEVARRLGGGGHKLAAGFKTRGSIKMVVGRIKELIKSDQFGNV